MSLGAPPQSHGAATTPRRRHGKHRCPRCGRPAQIREHERITEKHLRQPFYFTRWFYCTHDDCDTATLGRRHAGNVDQPRPSR
jgi:hypothetical protein